MNIKNIILIKEEVMGVTSFGVIEDKYRKRNVWKIGKVVLVNIPFVSGDN